MTPPELLVEAWLSTQNAFLAAKALEQELSGAEPSETPEAAPATEPEDAGEDFWQDWFGLWS